MERQSNSDGAVYIKNGHLLYRIKTKEVLAINTERNSVKKTACVPSIYVDKLEVIEQQEFDTALNKILAGL